MSIVRHAGNPSAPGVIDADSMVRTVREAGIIPFFENLVRGYSIEEHTPPQFWFDGDDGASLGPWDWKIECVRSGDIAYGKYLLGGKAAFATVPWYAELRNYRHSLPKYQPNESQQRILGYIDEHGSITIREVRALLGVKKSAADAEITRLQMQCRVVTGEIIRVYRGADLHYSGWQVASFCRPEALFGGAISGDSSILSPAPTDSFVAAAPRNDREEGFRPADRGGAAGLPSFAARALGLTDAPAHSPLEVGHSPEESLRRLKAHITALTGESSDKALMKILG